MDPYTCSAGVLPLTGVPDQSSVLTPAGWIYRSPVGNCFFAPHVMHPFPPSSQWLWCPPVPYGSPDAFQGHRPGSVVVCPPMTVLPGGHEVRAPAPIRRQRRNRRRRGCATRSSTTPAPHSRTSAERPTLERVVPVDRPTDVPVGRPTDAPPPGVAPANDDTVASTSVIQSPVAASAIPEPLLSVSTPLVTSSLQQYVQRHFDCPLGCCVTPAANLSSSSSVTGASDSDDTLLANNAFGLRVSRTTFSRMMNSIDSRIINEASDEPSSLSRRVEQTGSSSTDVAVVLGADSTQDRPVLVERRSAFHRYSRPASRSSASSVEILLGPIHADSSPASPTPIPQIMSQSPNRGSPTRRLPSTRRRSTPDASSFEYRTAPHRRPHEMYTVTLVTGMGFSSIKESLLVIMAIPCARSVGSRNAVLDARFAGVNSYVTRTYFFESWLLRYLLLVAMIGWVVWSFPWLLIGPSMSKSVVSNLSQYRAAIVL
ncbi:hypothetical protein QAD02_007845 [Eretmocerus hayati]|uniref:Uncharacterized protein n=1 Tax=Eretmocerus hayati TaxID=131215 RepID=A0ACC2N640_9HYME|nr:hypothetical protein QAD02_007845 [Eretmocerus hayati]